MTGHHCLAFYTGEEEYPLKQSFVGAIFGRIINKVYICRKIYKNVLDYTANTMTAKQEKQKKIEQERKAVLELLLEKTGIKRKELVDHLLGIWMAGNVEILSEQEKQQFPNLAF